MKLSEKLKKHSFLDHAMQSLPDIFLRHMKKFFSFSTVTILYADHKKAFTVDRT